MLEIIKTTLLGAACLFNGIFFIFVIAYLVSNFLISFFIIISVSGVLIACYEFGKLFQNNP